MIRTSRQLKALVRNMSGSDSAKAQIIIRNYIMERFLERLSLSQYRDHLILKGGVLVSAMVGLDNRSTMDVDATMKNHPLSLETAKEIIAEIVATPVDDGISFEIKSVEAIMDEAEYGGIRLSLDALLESMKTPLKIDLSTGDEITPKEISYEFKLMFEDRTISILAYNLETVLAEKLETIITKGTANTRMRDYYDLYILQKYQSSNIDKAILAKAFANTCQKRDSLDKAKQKDLILQEIHENQGMQQLWLNYGQRFDYAKDIAWNDIMDSARILLDDIWQTRWAKQS